MRMVQDTMIGRRAGLPRPRLRRWLGFSLAWAWLAFLAIVVWHLYGTLFKPGVYPMNPSWLTGKMPKEMYVEEHPAGPKLKVRSVRVRYEDEEEPGDGKTKALSAEGIDTADADRALRAADRSP